MGWGSDFERTREPERLPVVPAQVEVKSVLGRMEGPRASWLICSCEVDLRLSGALRLRVKDTGFEYEQPAVRQGKGRKDRRTLLPGTLEVPLRR